MMTYFEIELLPEAVSFLEDLDGRTREKIYYNLRKSQHIKDNELLKSSMTLFGIRTLYNNKAYRLFAFWDRNSVVIATHGILKKTKKTPLKEIKKAEEIRKQYLANKKK